MKAVSMDAQKAIVAMALTHVLKAASVIARPSSDASDESVAFRKMDDISFARLLPIGYQADDGAAVRDGEYVWMAVPVGEDDDFACRMDEEETSCDGW